MKTRHATITKILPFAIAIISALCCGSIAFAAVANAIDSNEKDSLNNGDVVPIAADQKGLDFEPSPEFPENENGQSYGSIINSETGSRYETSPDLIRVIGINGNLGYISKEEYSKVQSFVFDNFDIVVEQRMNAIEDTLSSLFCNTSISKDTVEKYARSVGCPELVEESGAEMLNAVSDSLELAMVSDSISEAALDNLSHQQLISVHSNYRDSNNIKITVNSSVEDAVYQAMEDACVTYINVYDTDGSTVVDQFKISY